MVGYKEDLAAWSEQTARAILERRFEELDLENVADEVLSLSIQERRALDSCLVQIMVHLLKCRYQQSRHTVSWDISIAKQRDSLEEILSDSPSLRPRVAERILVRYKRACLEAAGETGLELSVFPEVCPFTEVDILG